MCEKILNILKRVCAASCVNGVVGDSLPSDERTPVGETRLLDGEAFVSSIPEELVTAVPRPCNKIPTPKE